MREKVEETILEEARFYIKNRSTVRKTASEFNMSKSTIFNDLRYKLPGINPYLSKETEELMGINVSERHIRGGEATKKKFKATSNT